MEFLILAVLLGLIPAAIARSKGREFLVWWLYGALLFIVALPHALLMKANPEAIEARQESEGMKECPFCAEMIKAAANVCRYCGRDLPPAEPEARWRRLTTSSRRSSGGSASSSGPRAPTPT